MGFLDNNGLRRLWLNILEKLSERVDWYSFHALVGDTPVSDQIDDAVSNKMDKSNPTGTGSFSLNRKPATTVGDYSFAEGYNTTASGNSSHAQGSNSTALGLASHAEGSAAQAGLKVFSVISFDQDSFTLSSVEGLAVGMYYSLITSGNIYSKYGSIMSIDANANTITVDAFPEDAHNANYIFIEADKTLGDTSVGNYSHAEGYETKAIGNRSHAEGRGTVAFGSDSHVQGRYNIQGNYADIIGNGADVSHRSNAATVDWSGNAWYAGDVYVGSTSGTNKDDGSKKLATEEYVTSTIASGIKLSDKINGYHYIVEMENGHLVSSCCTTRIQVVTLPDTLSYAEGATLDMTGMIVQAWCEDGTTKIIDNAKCTWSGSMTAEDTTVAISYKEGETLFQDTFDVEITTS